MAALKDSHIPPPHEPNSAARGRDNYSLFGVLRTKPGRADSPPTRSMSCSDKIALWDIIGIQGALGSEFFVPLYISNVVVGGIPLAMQEEVKADCERAFWGRLSSLENGTYHARIGQLETLKTFPKSFSHHSAFIGLRYTLQPSRLIIHAKY
jgi:tRNA-specific adenosine deaminase 1